MILTLFALFFFLIFVGVPIAFALALSSTAVIWLFTDIPMLLVIQRMSRLLS